MEERQKSSPEGLLQSVDKVITSLDVMLKGTDDDASSGFFPRASAKPLRADALQGLVYLAIPREKAGMLGHPLF
ncbi:hypothetical protein [Salisediminibacterium halotolerans]|uniref:Uncharacterized protein n=1 Tax=Salisediminibacterium halotolerans TaxID=517425 RepID=A0A1H9QMW3_9BACI|nr:hypothetical protein [Salisediminibacterium haloalkalitolerans]SER61083.1 hypothetical protein SAMN05444126_10361 [Salisediminibacterium haloalkalitolerans]